MIMMLETSPNDDSIAIAAYSSRGPKFLPPPALAPTNDYELSFLSDYGYY